MTLSAVMRGMTVSLAALMMIPSGEAGTDGLLGGADDDFLSGSDDNDFLNGGTGTDNGDGGPGFNSCVNLETETNCQA
jgi:Ca2+-binding RTX toxin-like protein